MVERLRGFNIHPEAAQDWPDEFVDQYLNDLAQQGRGAGRDRAIQLLAEQGRGPAAASSEAEPDPEVEEPPKPKRRTRKEAE